MRKRIVDRIAQYTGKALQRDHEGFQPADRPLEDVDFVVLDTELTGFKTKSDSIVSLGAIWMTGARIDLGKTIDQTVRPRTQLTGQSVVVHGITPGETESAPDIDTVLPAFLEFCSGRVWVGHFLSLDLRFLDWECRRVMGTPLRVQAVDTLSLFEWLRSQSRNAFDSSDETAKDLGALATRLDIPASGLHNALSDAFITAQIFQRLLSQARPFGVRTLGDLMSVAKTGI